MTLPVDDRRWTRKLILEEFDGSKKDSVVRIKQMEGHVLPGRLSARNDQPAQPR
jgi:hypothetical protein